MRSGGGKHWRSGECRDNGRLGEKQEKSLQLDSCSDRRENRLDVGFEGGGGRRTFAQVLAGFVFAYDYQ